MVYARGGRRPVFVSCSPGRYNLCWTPKVQQRIRIYIFFNRRWVFGLKSFWRRWIQYKSMTLKWSACCMHFLLLYKFEISFIYEVHRGLMDGPAAVGQLVPGYAFRTPTNFINNKQFWLAECAQFHPKRLIIYIQNRDNQKNLYPSSLPWWLHSPQLEQIQIHPKSISTVYIFFDQYNAHRCAMQWIHRLWL